MQAADERRGEDAEASLPVLREGNFQLVDGQERGKKRFGFRYACASITLIALINVLNFCFEILNYDRVQNAFKVFISKKLNSSIFDDGGENSDDGDGV